LYFLFPFPSHRPSILKFHPQVLELTGDGGWKLYAAGDYQFSR